MQSQSCEESAFDWGLAMGLASSPFASKRFLGPQDLGDVHRFVLSTLTAWNMEQYADAAARTISDLTAEQVQQLSHRLPEELWAGLTLVDGFLLCTVSETAEAEPAARREETDGPQRGTFLNRATAEPDADVRGAGLPIRQPQRRRSGFRPDPQADDAASGRSERFGAGRPIR